MFLTSVAIILGKLRNRNFTIKSYLCKSDLNFLGTNVRIYLKL